MGVHIIPVLRRKSQVEKNHNEQNENIEMKNIDMAVKNHKCCTSTQRGVQRSNLYSYYSS